MTTIGADDSARAISRAIAELRAGRPFAMPTETVYGLAADACNGAAVARIFEMKGRPSFNPLICHVDGLAMAERLAVLTPAARRLAKAFWPGPLTLVVPVRPQSGIHELVTAGLGTVGLRCPKGIARAIISAWGGPVAAPSANRSGRVSPTSAAHLADEYPAEDLLVIDGGPSAVGLESTIVAVGRQGIEMLRPGAILAGEIEAVAGIPVTAPKMDGKVLAPGMMASHYAPRALVIPDCEELLADAAWLGFGNREAPGGAIAAINLSASSNLVEAAANLYAALKTLDASGAQRICVSPIPREGLGIAINDRLQRAAAPRETQAD